MEVPMVPPTLSLSTDIPKAPASAPASLRKGGSILAFGKLIPPLNFACVEIGVQRSGQPTTLNLPFLSTLHLKTILWLAVEEPSEPLLAFADEHDLTIHHLGIAEEGVSNPWDPLTESCISEAVGYMCDTRNFPLLVTCGMGRHRTGTVVGCLRRLQGWGLAATLEEYRRFTGGKRGRLVNEVRIEGFRGENVQLPPREYRADWLWIKDEPAANATTAE